MTRQKEKASAARRDARANLSPAEASAIRQRDREAKRVRREASRSSQQVTVSQSDTVGDTPEQSALMPVSEAAQLKVYNECAEHFGNTYLLRSSVCSVCDRLFSKSEIVLKSLSSAPVFRETILHRLRSPMDLPDLLKRQYDASSLDKDLEGLLLSPAGVYKCADGRTTLAICKSCKNSLSNSKLSSPPKFAIANGLFIGRLPEQFDDSTPTENAMLNLAQPTHFMSAVRGGSRTTIRSHAYVFRAKPSPPVNMVPANVMELGAFKVRMVGAMTPLQKALTRKRYQVRSQRLLEQARWYQSNNSVYQTLSIGVCETSAALDTTVVVDQCENASAAANEMDARTWRFNAPQPSHVLDTQGERDNDPELDQQEYASIITDYPQTDANQCVHQVVGDPDVVVYRSSEILSDFDPRFWKRSFCELWPFGRGGHDEIRRVPIGLHEYIKHCMELSSRRFGMHPSFVLVAFDVLARHRAINAIYLVTRPSSRLAERAASVSREQLQRHLENQEKRIAAIRRGHTAPTVQDDSNVDALRGGIDAGMKAYWGSNLERLSARADLFAMSSSFGQPTIFFTLSPSSSTA